ncbi:hypothetical protein N7532_004203 [Penicillium argentinense]|uniref:Autophagy-related protein 11 n=1 Tax=Penicillium argentinense TaxID=1131581 RepID=A0A9W9FNX4_9EURO|nr:uncharacterized protein N7532_004203 [Penicillium argentinense]KAJ5103674.1 hypothetical protein N7532_004203 [Penicillium argentinense]
MSLHIYIAHSGEHLLADPVSFASTEALKTWIVQNTSIPPTRQILMTALGKNVKIQTLATETEIFVYDRQYVSDPGDAELPELPRPESFRPTSPPASITDQNDLQSWRNLFMKRRSWALELSTRCEAIDKQVREHNERTDVIHRGLGVALENLKSHVGTLEHRFQEAQTWANNLLQEQESALDGWQRALSTLESIPARKDFPMLGRPSTPKIDKDRPTGTLLDFVDVPEVQRAGSDVALAAPRFSGQMRDMERIVTDIATETQHLVDDSFPNSENGEEGLLEEVETIAKKIHSDYEHVLGLPNNQRMLANISRLALNHTQNLLPSLFELGKDIHYALEESWRRRSAAGKKALQQMRTISFIESRLAEVHSQIVELDVDSNSFDIICSVFQMPMVYGSVLIECTRRQEWSGKIKADSLSLAEEMAVLRDEEQRRRKKWVKNMGDFISFGDTNAPGIEVNIQGQDDEWPDVSRKEIELYIDELRSKHSLAKIADDLTVQFKELDAPTRQQRRRAKAFKNGSVFDLGRSSMLLRGDDVVRSLREEKAKLEERVKGSDSRIRKLEDLLHRQSHLSRPSSGNFGPDFPSSPASPHPDAMSRRSSVSSRRVSMNQSPEDRALVQRIVTLEAELAAEKETVQRLHKEAHAERQSSSDKYQEAQSTKKDLIGNLEARQREFEDERRFIEAELKKVRHRNEEVEEELDRLTDSREHEKHELDERIHQLEVDLQAAHISSREEAAKITGLSERIHAQQEEEQKLKARIESLEQQQGEWSQRDHENYNALQSAFMNLSPGGAVPFELSGIIKAIDILSEGLSIHARSAEESATKAMAEAKSFEERNAQLESDLEATAKSVEDKETKLSQLQQELSDTQSKLDNAMRDLEQERSALTSLQNQVSAGESGSDALREQIAEEQQKHADLSQRLANAETEARDFKDNQSDWEKRLEDASEAVKQAVARVNSRGSKSHDISKRLFSQVEALVRMLEQMGFAIVQQNGHLAVQRASKINSSSSLGESLAQSATVSMKPDASLLAWLDAETQEEEETKFAAFIEGLAQFDLTSFGETVIKRVKDLETYARRYVKESRAYRDRYHRAQSEAHEKIAYRSFKEGDVALFLPTRNQAIRSWAAFNINAPHYFLREQDSHKLDQKPGFLLALLRLKSEFAATDKKSLGEASDGNSLDDDNPFALSDGLRWYLVDAIEEKPGAPATPGISKSTVASAHVDAKGSIRLKRPTEESTVAQTLSRSLDSRRNSSNSKRGTPTPSHKANDSASDIVRPAGADVSSQPREAAPIFNEVRRDLLFHENQDPASASEAQLPTSDIASSASPPSRSTSTRSQAKARTWEKLWSMDYRRDETGKY